MVTRTLGTLVLVLLAIAFFLPAALNAGPISLTVSAPTRAGTDEFEIDPPGGDAGTVRLALLGTETARQKADKLADEFTNKRIAFTRDAATMTEFVSQNRDRCDRR